MAAQTRSVREDVHSASSVAEATGARMRNRTAAPVPAPNVLGEAVRRHRLLGTREFCVSFADMAALVAYILASTTKPELSLNRPQVGGRRLVHRAQWQRLSFSCVSTRAMTVG